MPAVAVCRPHYTCHNFPLCEGTQYRPRGEPRSDFCRACRDNLRTCAFPGCEHPCAPMRGRMPAPTTCTLHYKDPAQRHLCQWQRCANLSIGCRELAATNTLKKRLCHLCSNRSLPCLHALSGCPHRALDKTTRTLPQQEECQSHIRRRCLHSPDQSLICRSLGCTFSVSPPAQLCDQCLDGKVMFRRVLSCDLLSTILA